MFASFFGLTPDWSSRLARRWLYGDASYRQRLEVSEAKRAIKMLRRFVKQADTILRKMAAIQTVMLSKGCTAEDFTMMKQAFEKMETIRESLLKNIEYQDALIQVYRRK